MAERAIEVRGARTHHLKDLSLDLPREAWTVVAGVSGSGKSSLVLDTLGAESYRRFLGTLARAHDAGALPRPDVDRIDGLPPAVAAGFLSRAPGPRETLGTVTEIHDALRVLFARAAVPHCPRDGVAIAVTSPERVIESLLALPEGTKVVLYAPRGRGQGAVAAARRDGFVRARVAGVLARLDEGLAGPGALAEPVAAEASVEVVVDRLVARPGARARFADSVDQGFRTGGGVLRATVEGGAETTFSARPFCGVCGTVYPPLTPPLFSFESPKGACPACQGTGFVPVLDPERVLPRDARLSKARGRVLPAIAKAARPAIRRAFDRAMKEAGVDGRAAASRLSESARATLVGVLAGALRGRPAASRFEDETACPACGGGRLAPFPAAARLGGRPIGELEALPAAELGPALEAVPLEGSEGALARPARDDAVARCRFLVEVGLGYLAPARAAGSLSGGELRRARLAGACAARMSGLLFLLDEPTAGLHPADSGPLRKRLRGLVDEGNTVVCVEHDPQVLLDADHVIELGPGAGAEGGRILAQGPAKQVVRAGASPLARALTRKPPAPRATSRAGKAPVLRVVGARRRNLKDVDASFPAGAVTAVTGVSGTGKSTLVLDVLAPAARAAITGAPFPSERLVRLDGASAFDRVSVSDGAPSRHPRATPGSVLGVLARVRDLFAATVEARARGFAPRRFSTNVPGGRCEECRGLGVRTVSLRHLPEAQVPCDACGGRRFRRETLEVRVKGLSIADVLELPLSRAAETFRDLSEVARPLAAATEVGLGYVPLGEPTDRLSGGEALRLRLAAALGRAGRSRTLYCLDEPCAGLHPDDVDHLTAVLARLAAEGNAVVAVEHHPSFIRQADHVVDLGPGPGEEGGRVVVEGTPADVARCLASRTGRALG